MEMEVSKNLDLWFWTALTVLTASFCVQIHLGEAPDPVHAVGGRVRQQLLLQSRLRTVPGLQPELCPHLPEHSGSEPGERQPLLHCLLPFGGRWLHLRLGQDQPELAEPEQRKSF